MTEPARSGIWHGPIALTRYLLLGVALLACPDALEAQEKLVGASTVTTGVAFERWSLPTAMSMPTSSGNALVTGASQSTVPLAIVVPLNSTWTADLYTSYVSGQVRLVNADGSAHASYRLEGPTDTKLRLVGRLKDDALLLTLGMTVPTGRTKLDSDQLSALSVLAAPALRFRSPVLGAGLGATLGLVLSREVSGWGLALGTSYEMRGTYAPAEALQAGTATTDLRPGNGVHASLAAERTSGFARHMLSVGTDVYQNGELRNQPGADGSSTLRLGPSFTGSYELDAAWGSYESALFVVGRRRTAFALGGSEVPQSGRTEVESGMQTFHALTPSRGVRVALDARVHTTSRASGSAAALAGSSPDVGFSTAGVRSAGATLAMRFGQAQGPWMMEPFARGQLGRLNFDTASRTITGVSAGITMAGRF